MRKPIVMLLVLLIAVGVVVSGANAIVDQTPDAIGFYWDEKAEVVERDCYDPFMMGHFIITNPTFATFQGIQLEFAASYLRSNPDESEHLPVNGILGIIPASMGYSSSFEGLPLILYRTVVPVVPTEIFEIYTLVFLTPEQGLDVRYQYELIYFYINPAPDFEPLSGEGILVLSEIGGEYVQLNPIAPSGHPVASLNYDCWTPAESTSWGAVKSLYR